MVILIVMSFALLCSVVFAQVTYVEAELEVYINGPPPSKGDNVIITSVWRDFLDLLGCPEISKHDDDGDWLWRIKNLIYGYQYKCLCEGKINNGTEALKESEWGRMMQSKVTRETEFLKNGANKPFDKKVSYYDSCECLEPNYVKNANNKSVSKLDALVNCTAIAFSPFLSPEEQEKVTSTENDTAISYLYPYLCVCVTGTEDTFDGNFFYVFLACLFLVIFLLVCFILFVCCFFSIKSKIDERRARMGPGGLVNSCRTGCWLIYACCARKKRLLFVGGGSEDDTTEEMIFFDDNDGGATASRREDSDDEEKRISSLNQKHLEQSKHYLEKLIVESEEEKREERIRSPKQNSIKRRSKMSENDRYVVVNM